jgi:hypothetical protein
MVASLLVFRLFSVDEEDADEDDTLEHVDEADEWRNAWFMGMAEEVAASLAIRAVLVAVVGGL